MPTPVKAYIDPTGFTASSLARWLPEFVNVPKIGISLPALAVAHTPALIPSSMVVVVTANRMGKSNPEDTRPRLPTPPLGRQCFLTFPSIYKERGYVVWNPGQFYPPPAP